MKELPTGLQKGSQNSVQGKKAFLCWTIPHLMDMNIKVRNITEGERKSVAS